MGLFHSGNREFIFLRTDGWQMVDRFTVSKLEKFLSLKSTNQSRLKSFCAHVKTDKRRRGTCKLKKKHCKMRVQYGYTLCLYLCLRLYSRYTCLYGRSTTALTQEREKAYDNACVVLIKLHSFYIEERVQFG